MNRGPFHNPAEDIYQGFAKPVQSNAIFFPYSLKEHRCVFAPEELCVRAHAICILQHMLFDVINMGISA